MGWWIEAIVLVNPLSRCITVLKRIEYVVKLVNKRYLGVPILHCHTINIFRKNMEKQTFITLEDIDTSIAAENFNRLLDENKTYF